jgi:hypothetical protein
MGGARKEATGRRMKDLERLKAGLPLYRIRLAKKMSVEEALRELSESGHLSEANMDQRDARRLLKDLKDLLAPMEED